MRKFLLLFVLVLAIFYIEYEGYYWDPCDTQDGTCLAIYCPPGGCFTSGTKVFCPDAECVKKILNKQGQDHLGVIYKIEWGEYFPEPIIRKMKPVPSYDIIFEEE